MVDHQPRKERPTGRRSLFPRAGSASASIGIATGLLVLCSLGASSWWMFRDQKASAERERVGEIDTLGAILSRSAETLLAADELSSLRRLVVETSRSHDLDRCRIMLPDGRIVADASPMQITARVLPDTWPKGDVDWPDEGNRAGCVSRAYTLAVPGRGPGRLEIAAEVGRSVPRAWEAQAGMGAIASAALALLLIFHRRIRSRLRSVGAIRESLLARRSGERSVSVLGVSEDLGEEAACWNDLLREHEKLRESLAMAETKAKLSTGSSAQAGLERACDAMSQGLLLVDEDLCIRYANGAASAFLKLKGRKIAGTRIDQLIKAEDVLEAVRLAAGGTVCRPTAVEVEDPGIGGVLRFSVRPVRREDAVAAMVIIEDITQKRAAEKATNAFVAQATHELRTPLTNIRLYVEAAMEDGESDPDRLAECLNIINQEARRLEATVGDVLSVAEIEAGSFHLKKDDVRVADLLRELEADYKAQASQKGIDLAFELPAKLPTIQGDRAKIMLTLQNLIGNALKYTPAEGAVRVTARVEESEIEVEVTDTGIGIKAEDLGRVFQRFFRAEDRRVSKITGSGLGLALAREVVRFHGGDIVVQSELDKGSSFTMSLPISAEEAV